MRPVALKAGQPLALVNWIEFAGDLSARPAYTANASSTFFAEISDDSVDSLLLRFEWLKPRGPPCRRRPTSLAW